MATHQVIPLLLHEPPQLPPRRSIARGEHLFFKGYVHHPMGLRDLHGRTAAGHLHGPAQLPEGRQIGPVEIHNMGVSRRSEKDLGHVLPLYVIFAEFVRNSVSF